jgi:TolA-binding protein
VSEPVPRVEVEAPDAGATMDAARPLADARGAESARSARPEPPRDAGPSEEESMYQRAHQAHFVAHDSAAALRAWDDYLQAYPNGRFALEARYNRALALVRLGRYAEARAALAPFASGQYGGYRQSEAKALLDAMDAGP